MTLRDVILRTKANVKHDVDNKSITKGFMVAVEFEDDPRVDGRSGFVWVKERGSETGCFQCFNPNTLVANNLPVLISKDSKKPSKSIILGVDWETIPIDTSYAGQAYGVATHGISHEWLTRNPGLDAINVYPRAFIPFKVHPGTDALTISVQSGFYLRNNTLVTFIGNYGIDLTDYVPTTVGNTVAILVYLDVVLNDAVILSGTEGVSPIPVCPTFPEKAIIPLAVIMLYEGQTYISEADIVEDYRPWMTVTGAYDSHNPDAISESEWDLIMSRHMVEGV